MPRFVGVVLKAHFSVAKVRALRDIAAVESGAWSADEHLTPGPPARPQEVS